MEDPPALICGLGDGHDFGVQCGDQGRRALLRVVIVQQDDVGEYAEFLRPVEEPAIRLLLQVAAGRRVDEVPPQDPEAAPRGEPIGGEIHEDTCGGLGFSRGARDESERLSLHELWPGEAQAVQGRAQEEQELCTL